MKKRIALVLALVMIFSIMPMSAFGLSTVGSGSPRTINETADRFIDDPTLNTNNRGSFRVNFTREDLQQVEDDIAAGNGLFEMRVQLNNGEVWDNVNDFDWNFPGANHRAAVVAVLDEDGNMLNNTRDNLIDEFRVQFMVDPAAVISPEAGANIAHFTVRMHNMIAGDSAGSVTADLSASYFRTNPTVRDRTYDLFGGWDVWGTATLFNLADDVDIWMGTEKHFSRGGMWNDIGYVWLEERVPGAFGVGDELELELPRGFYWDQDASVQIVTTHRDVRGVIDNNNNTALTTGTIPAQDVEYTVDSNVGRASKRKVTIRLPGNVIDDTTASKFAIEGLRIMADRRIAETGEVVAEIGGDPSFSQDEMTVAIYGEQVVEIKRHEDEPKTVWSGKFQELNRLEINESIWEAIPRNATIELTLPEGVKWREPVNDSNYLDLGREPQIHSDSSLEDMRFVGFDNNGNLAVGQDDDLAWYIVDNNRQTIAVTVSHESTDRDDLRTGTARSERLDAGGDRVGAKLILENLRVAIDTQFQNKDIEVEVHAHGWSETVVLGHAKPAVEVRVDEVADVKLGLRNQPIGDIFIEETEVEAVSRGLGSNHVRIKFEGDALARQKFTKTPSAEVIPGQGGNPVDALQIERIWMNPSMDEINIQIKDFSADVPSTIHLYDLELTVDRTAPEGDVEMFIGGGGLIDVGAPVFSIDDDEYFLNSSYLHRFTVANVVNPHDRPWHEIDAEEVEVGFSVGETTYMVNGQSMTMDVAPFIQDGRMMVPVRYLEPVFGVQPSWSDSARTVTIPYQGAMYSMQIGSYQLMVNGTPMIDMEAPAQIVSERTFVPISRFARAMGIEYDWDAASQSVTFSR